MFNDDEQDNEATNEQLRKMQTDALRAVIERGMDFEAFITGPLGRYLVATGEINRRTLLNEMVELDPHDAPNHARIQCAVKAIDCWQGWMSQAIDKGYQAQEQFTSAG